jgi:hypothetical protein
VKTAHQGGLNGMARDILAFFLTACIRLAVATKVAMPPSCNGALKRLTRNAPQGR